MSLRGTAATELTEKFLVPLLTDEAIMEKLIKAHEAQKELNRSLQDIGRDCVRRWTGNTVDD